MENTRKRINQIVLSAGGRTFNEAILRYTILSENFTKYVLIL